MPKRALIEQRPWLLASLVAGISFFFVKDSHLPGLYQMAWKGAGVALLAVWAFVRHPSRDARQIALVMALGALGDVLIEVSLAAGAAAFFAGHMVAINLYLRHHRTVMSQSQKQTCWALLLLTPTIAFRLPADRSMAAGVAIYALAVGAMAAAAWASSFSRYRVGLGAVMFVLSDLLIFARLGPLAQSMVPGLLIWPLYYFGQFLIATGVIDAVRTRSTLQ
ncbi:MAG: lysoplasmalogenase family protein [Novosphingobium sp.]